VDNYLPSATWCGTMAPPRKGERAGRRDARCKRQGGGQRVGPNTGLIVGNGRVLQAINQTLVTSGTINTAVARAPGPRDDMKPRFHPVPAY